MRHEHEIASVSNSTKPSPLTLFMRWIRSFGITASGRMFHRYFTRRTALSREESWINPYSFFMERDAAKLWTILLPALLLLGGTSCDQNLNALRPPGNTNPITGGSNIPIISPSMAPPPLPGASAPNWCTSLGSVQVGSCPSSAPGSLPSGPPTFSSAPPISSSVPPGATAAQCPGAGLPGSAAGADISGHYLGTSTLTDGSVTCDDVTITISGTDITGTETTSVPGNPLTSEYILEGTLTGTSFTIKAHADGFEDAIEYTGTATANTLVGTEKGGTDYPSYAGVSFTWIKQ
jgi:hypothetical protein